MIGSAISGSEFNAKHCVPKKVSSSILRKASGREGTDKGLVVDTVESWIYTLSRAARRAGASEIVVCENLHAVENATKRAI